MTSIVIQLLLITLAVSAYSFKDLSDTDCSTTGLQCSRDCKNVIYCPTNTGNPVIVRDCPTQTFCSISTGFPECDADFCSGSSKPACSSPGAIPSPSDCHIYYVCTSTDDTDPFEVTCADGEVFNTVTLQCAKSDVCREPVKCEEVGDTGIVDPEAGVFCYYCQGKNHPFIYKCKTKLNINKA